MTPRQALNAAYPPVNQKPQQQLLNPYDGGLEDGIAQLAKTLMDPDEGRRQAASQNIRAVCMPCVQERIIDRLMDALNANQGEIRRQVVASLADFGAYAVRALTLKFLKEQSVSSQAAALEPLLQVVPRLNPQERFSLITELIALAPFAADESIRRSVWDVMLALRAANERSPVER